MNAARHACFPRCKPLGMGSIPTLCAFTSEDSHYSIKSAAAGSKKHVDAGNSTAHNSVLGIGTDNCFNIPVDRYGTIVFVFIHPI